MGQSRNSIIDAKVVTTDNVNIYVLHIEASESEYDLDIEASESEYDLDIEAMETSTRKYIHWSITCEVTEENVDEKYISFHPFRLLNECDIDDICVSEVIADNSLVREILKYVIMPDVELGKYCGNTTACCYRATLIKMLHDLWD